MTSKKTRFSKLILTVTFIYLLSLAACNSRSGDVVTFYAINSPYQFYNNTSFNNDVVIEPGVIIELGDSVSITFKGNLKAIGNKESRITIKPINNQWKYLLFEGDMGEHRFEYVSIYNGKLLFKAKTKVYLTNVSFKNTAKQLFWDGLIAMYEGSYFYGDSITMASNNTGEGIVIGNLDSATIKNSYFKNVNDGFELLSCKSGLIDNCVFESNSLDDAIDLNGCSNIIIQNNHFSGISDRCLEMGLHDYYKTRTKDIVVLNNTFTDSRIGIQSKEGSEIHAAFNTFKDCIYATEVIDSLSSLKNYNSIIVGVDSAIVLTDNASNELMWTSSVSDSILNGVNNCSQKTIKTTCKLQVNLFTKLIGSKIEKAGFQNEKLNFPKSKIPALKD